MNFKPSTVQRPGVSQGARGFTLAEVLAALVFMAIVIPVAVKGLQIASLAGEVGQRKSVAARIADRVLTEAVISNQTQGGSQRGVIQEDQQQYQYVIRSQPWNVDSMLQVTVQVTFTAQGKDYDVLLTTLVDNTVQ
jgi:prepilin-type N-terminal cleavage/methylation domain-containing protein